MNALLQRAANNRPFFIRLKRKPRHFRVGVFFFCGAIGEKVEAEWNNKAYGLDTLTIWRNENPPNCTDS